MDKETQRLIACRLIRSTPIGDGLTVFDLLPHECFRKAVYTSEAYARKTAFNSELEEAKRAAEVQLDDVRKEKTIKHLFPCEAATFTTEDPFGAIEAAIYAAVIYFHLDEADSYRNSKTRGRRVQSIPVNISRSPEWAEVMDKQRAIVKEYFGRYGLDWYNDQLRYSFVGGFAKEGK